MSSYGHHKYFPQPSPSMSLCSPFNASCFLQGLSHPLLSWSSSQKTTFWFCSCDGFGSFPAKLPLSQLALDVSCFTGLLHPRCRTLHFAALRWVTASPFLQPGAALCIAQRNPLSLAVQPGFDPPCPYVSILAMRILQESVSRVLLRPHKQHPFPSPYPGS